MSFNRVYNPYPGAYVLKSYSEVEPVSAVQRTLEVTPLVARGVIEDYSFPGTAEAGADQSWSAKVHNIGDTGILALGIVNTTGNPGPINVTWQGTVHNLPPGTYLRIRTPAEVPNCSRIDTQGTIEFTVVGGYTLKLWGMHPVDSDWYYDDEKIVPVTVAESGWPVTRRIHAFDNYKLKAESWELAKKKTYPGPVNVDTNVLQGGKLEYTVKYTQGSPLAENADIYFNGTKIITERLNKGQTKTGSFDLTGRIEESNTTAIKIESAPGFWSEIIFDVWITLGFSEEPEKEPGVNWWEEWWENRTLTDKALMAGVGLGTVYIVAVRPRMPAMPTIVTVPYPVLRPKEGE